MLKPVRNKVDYENGLDRIYILIQQGNKRSKVETDELEVVSIFIKEYENKHFPIPPPHPLEAIKFRIEQMGLKQSDLNDLFGNRRRKSDIFSGKRKLTIKMIRILHEKLNIPAEILIADY